MLFLGSLLWLEDLVIIGIDPSSCIVLLAFLEVDFAKGDNLLWDLLVLDS
jgi:hypothetical protein